MPEGANDTGQAEGQGAASETGSGVQDGQGVGQGWMDSLPAEARDYIRQLRSESARYRAERNTIREEATTLRTRVEAHDRGVVQSIAADKLIDPTDLTITDLAEVRGDDGQIDESKVRAKVDELVAAKPHFAKPTPPRNWGQGARGTGTGGPTSIGEALKQL